MPQQDIIAEIKNKDLPVIIYGAGIVGKVLLSVCKDQGIAVACFCDSSKKVARSRFCGLEVIYAPDLKETYANAIFLISAAAIKDVVERLSDLGCANWYAGGLLLKDLDLAQDQAGGAIDYTKFAIENCILCHDGYLDPDKLFLRSIDLVITERCSLRCRDCSNLMQYYQNPQDCDIDLLKRSIETFCAIFDQVMDFRLIGGETFMNKQWPILVQRLVTEDKIKRIVLYSNGTIIPKQTDILNLKNSKVLVIITDYGTLSRKLKPLIAMFEDNEIAYHLLKVEEWLDCSAINSHKRTARDNQEIYSNCCAKNMATLSDGKLFRCPYAANVNRLGAVADSNNDYIDLLQEPHDPDNIEETKNMVRNFIWRKDYLKTCDYCSGRPLSGAEVQPAIQADKPLAYHKYS